MVARKHSTPGARLFTLSGRDTHAALVTRLFQARNTETVRNHVQGEVLKKLWTDLKIERATPDEVAELLALRVRIEVLA